MKKLFTVAACVIMLVNFSVAEKLPKGGKKKESTENTGLSKEEKKKIEAELKEYMKNPEGYKAKKDANQAVLDSNDIQIKQLTQDLATATSKQAELQNRLNECDAQVKNDEQEKRDMQSKTDEQPSSSTSSSVSSATTNAPTKGVIYKVQLGMYKGLNINKDFDQPRLISYEEVDGMNRYVISYFADEAAAQNFVKDIRKLGIRDAFVAKYIDGTRVYEWSDNPKYKGKKVPSSLEDALQNK